MAKVDHFTEKFIEQVKNFKVLNDLSHFHYRNIRIKNKTWDEIAKLLDIEGLEGTENEMEEETYQNNTGGAVEDSEIELTETEQDSFVFVDKIKKDECEAISPNMMPSDENVTELTQTVNSLSLYKGKDYELEAIKSLERKLNGNTRVPFCPFSLEASINFICKAPVDDRKVLLLYLHNGQHPFSKTFCKIFDDEQIAQILNKNFLVLGWDIENVEYHNALIKALNVHANLLNITDYVIKKRPICLCILPVSGTICIFLSFLEPITVKQAIKKLKLAETEFEEEIRKEKELNKLTADKCNQNDWGSEQLQCVWADLLGNRDYDSFEWDQHEDLKDKIGFALFGTPKKESGYEKKEKAQINKLYDVIRKESDQIAEFKDTIEIAIIYNCLEPLPKEKVKRGAKFDDYNPQTDVNPVPIFVLRKCRDCENPCRIFIDDTGRVYQRWNDYLTENKYPKCEMIVPLNGRYKIKDGEVLLEKHLSPACHIGRKFLLVGDITSSLVATGSAIAIGVAAVPAVVVAPPVIAVAAAGGIGAGIWAIGRSSYTVWDRKQHKETMSFANSEARAVYLNIVAGTVAFAGAGANLAVAVMALRGLRIGLGATRIVSGVVGALNVGAGGASIVNSGYNMVDQWISEHDIPLALRLLQLRISGLFFGHAVHNFNGSETIDETQVQLWQGVLMNRSRKSINQVINTLQIQDVGQEGRTEVISALRSCPDEDEVFSTLESNTKAVCRTGINLIAEDRQLKLNDTAIDVKEFIGLNTSQTEIYITNLPKQDLNEPTQSFRVSVNILLLDLDISSGDIRQLLVTGAALLLSFCNEETQIKLLSLLHRAVQYISKELAEKFAIPFCEAIGTFVPKYARFFELLRLGISYVGRKVDQLEEKYQKYQETQASIYYDPLFDHINPVYAKRTVDFFQKIVDNIHCLTSLVRNNISELSNYIMAWIARLLYDHVERENRETLRLCHSTKIKVERTSCPVCSGYYYKRAK